MKDKEIERLKERYLPGTRLVLDHMDDPFAVQDGMAGTVEGVDEAGDILMKWDNGRTLSLIPHVDEFHKEDEMQANDQEMTL